MVKNRFGAFAPTTRNLIERVVYCLGVVSGIVLILVMGLMCCEVFFRYVLNRPIVGTVEISEYMLVFIAFAAIAYVQLVDGHIKIELVTEHLSPKVQRSLRIIALVVALVVFATITWSTAQAFWESWLVKEIRWGARPLPVWPAKFLIPAGSLLLCIQLITNLIDEIQQRVLGAQPKER